MLRQERGYHVASLGSQSSSWGDESPSFSCDSNAMGQHVPHVDRRHTSVIAAFPEPTRADVSFPPAHAESAPSASDFDVRFASHHVSPGIDPENDNKTIQTCPKIVSLVW